MQHVQTQTYTTNTLSISSQWIPYRYTDPQKIIIWLFHDPPQKIPTHNSINLKYTHSTIPEHTNLHSLSVSKYTHSTSPISQSSHHKPHVPKYIHRYKQPNLTKYTDYPHKHWKYTHKQSLQVHQPLYPRSDTKRIPKPFNIHTKPLCTHSQTTQANAPLTLR